MNGDMLGPISTDTLEATARGAAARRPGGLLAPMEGDAHFWLGYLTSALTDVAAMEPGNPEAVRQAAAALATFTASAPFGEGVARYALDGTTDTQRRNLLNNFAKVGR